MKRIVFAFGLAAVITATAVYTSPAHAQKPTMQPSLEVCQTALIVGVRTGTTELEPIVDTISAKLGFTAEQTETQRVVCRVYFAGVADGVRLAQQSKDI